MKILNHELKPLFIEAVHKAFPDLTEAELLEIVTVEDPKDAAHGDYACPVAFKLTKILGRPPKEIGDAIVENFPKDDYRVGDVSFVAPGFVNLRLAVSFLEEELKQLENGFSVEKAAGRTRPVIVEYPSTNAAKHMAVHHIITTVLGDSIANLFDFMGYEVIRINHLGDWGTQFGKIIYALDHWGDEKVVHKDPNNELANLYVKFNEEAEEDDALNHQARAIFRAMERGDAGRIEQWKWIVSESVTDLEKMLKRLGVEIDHHIGESFYLKMADEILKEGVEKGIFVEGEGGALIFNMGENETPALIQKSDGATLYLTRDLAVVKYRKETWNPEAVLYVVDHAQSLHFKQDFAIAEAMDFVGDTSLEHVSFGRMSFKDRSMSTRKGNVIQLENLLEEAMKRAGELAKEKESGLSGEEMERLAEVVGIGSIKYGILAQDRVKDIIFDWDKVITLEGNSAPYLLYSYARAHGILEKVGDVPLSGLPKLTEEAEIELVRAMIKFPHALEFALAERKPHMICTYLFDLCHAFNKFYGSVRVMEAETEGAKRSRVGLVNAFMYQLKVGLNILGIPVLNKM